VWVAGNSVWSHYTDHALVLRDEVSFSIALYKLPYIYIYIFFLSHQRLMDDVEIFEIVQPVFELRHREWRRCGWFFGENLTNLMTSESKDVNHLWKENHVAVFVFEDAEVTAADSSINLCTIRCEFNRKIKWRKGNRKHFNLTLEIEYMWNFNGIRISFASNNIVGRNNNLSLYRRRQSGWKIKDGGL